MLKRTHRDIDLPSLVPPQFCAASEARQAEGGGEARRLSAAWEGALLSAYMVDSEMPRGPTAGLGMGLEIVPNKSEPKWNGSWSSHHDYMKFIFGEETQAKLVTSSSSSSNSTRTKTLANPPNNDDDDDDGRVRKRRRASPESQFAQADDEPQLVVHDATPDGLRQSAQDAAQRTTLRRGFFASALKRQLEALRDENRRLKRLAVEVLDDRECNDLFADLGSEQRIVVKRRAGLDDALESSRCGPSDVDSADCGVARRDLTLVQVVQQAQRAFVVTNPALPDNPIVWSSDVFSKLTGYDRAEVCGRNCRFLQGPKTNPKAVDTVRAAIAKSHEASVVLLNYRKDGSTFWNRFFIAPLRDSKGTVTFYVGVQTDVSSSVRSIPPSPALLPDLRRPNVGGDDDDGLLNHR